MRKWIVFGIIFLWSPWVWAQQSGIPFDEYESLTSQLNKAKIQNDVPQEIQVLWELIQLSSETINYNQTYAYCVELESLIIDHINLPVVKKIIHPFYSEMGRLLIALSEYESSMEYYKKAMFWAEQLGLQDEKYHDLGAFAFNKFLVGKRQEADSILRIYLKDAENLKKPELIADAHFRFYNIYIDTLPQLAIYHSRKSLETKDLKDFAHRTINLGTCFFRLGESDSALYYTEKGLTLAKTNGFKTQESNAIIQMREIYLMLGDYKKSLEYFEAFYWLQYEANTFQNGMKLMVVNQEILKEKLQLQESLAEVKISNQRTLIWIFGISVLVLGIVLFLLNNRIRLINHQKKRIEEEKNRAEESERYVEQFLTNLSHEIRTPMHAISGMINALLRNPDSEFKGEYLEAMRISSDNLLVLLNDILDLAKIESGKMEISPEQMKPMQVASGVVHLFKFKASEKGLDLGIEVSENFPETMLSDPSRLTQVLINLIGNAIKFTDSGYIRLKLSRVGDKARFEVIDTGMGIPQEKLKVIFDSFEQVDQLQSRKQVGTGLGLSISKKLIELQGGEIWVESELGKGSSFIFELPIIAEKNSAIDVSSKDDVDSTSLGKKLKGIRILLVDDDEFNMMVVQDDLSYFIPEVELTIGKSGEEAIELFKTRPFDLILMDIHMPGMGGIEAAKRIRELESSQGIERKIPIIALTANIVQSEIDKFLASGMEEYIPKPYKIEEILVKLSRFYKK
ncbi:signal transduction histidine kinase [Algoriphagus boseongensis]|uniref:histidine kinase n=1 Tax=Algoriphagus boseongensis TaxID=1442587 RepID=A0A4R6T241_9BACT|nr:ATP-binding protein [Algoriphagus boseongensis]TDQ15062.1 signal transduction histidine kinase [Algoriphagus boseongensis]